MDNYNNINSNLWIYVLVCIFICNCQMFNVVLMNTNLWCEVFTYQKDALMKILYKMPMWDQDIKTNFRKDTTLGQVTSSEVLDGLWASNLWWRWLWKLYQALSVIRSQVLDESMTNQLLIKQYILKLKRLWKTGSEKAHLVCVWVISVL